MWQTYTAAPHRMFFLPGIVQAVVVISWWLLALPGQISDASLPSAAMHGWLVLYGLFPFFIFGFLLTAVPNWLNARAIARSEYLPAALLMSLGAVLFYVPVTGVKTLALLAHLAGWLWALWPLLRRLRESEAKDKTHPWLTWWATLLGAVGALAMLLGQTEMAMILGLWAFLTPLFLTVCHRMLPWFTSRVIANYVVIRPLSPLVAMLAACLAHAGLEMAVLPHWTWLVDLPLALMTLWFISRWGIARSFSVRLLAMLHIAFVWAAVAFVLYGVNSLALWFEWSWSAGRAPLHALGMGFFGAMLLGMASRVSLGHSGRKLECDATTWGLFWLIQAAALVRMMPEFMPLPVDGPLLSGGLWLIAFGLWAMRYAPMTWRPRVDGKPG